MHVPLCEQDIMHVDLALRRIGVSNQNVSKITFQIKLSTGEHIVISLTLGTHAHESYCSQFFLSVRVSVCPCMCYHSSTSARRVTLCTIVNWYIQCTCCIRMSVPSYAKILAIKSYFALIIGGGGLFACAYRIAGNFCRCKLLRKCNQRLQKKFSQFLFLPQSTVHFNKCQYKFRHDAR